VIHRDIKPENVLLHEGEAVVTDFGIALAISEAGGTRLTETGFSLGTPHYMSPEQAAGEQDLNARSDVYSLGCVLYEMLAGEPPFTGNTAQSVIAKRLSESPPSVTTLRDTVPTALDACLTKALARSSADRYESAAAFATALTDDPRATTRIATTPARWSHPVAAAGLFGVASLAVLGVVYVVMLQLGLPDWVLRAAVGLLVVGLPIILATAFSERRMLTGAHRQSHRWLNWRRALHGGGLAFMSLGIVTAGFMAMRALGIGPAGTLMAKGLLEQRDPILLADFENRTSDSTLGETITGGLRIDLSQSRVVRLVEPATVAAARERMVADPDAPLDEALAREVAEREGIRAILAGEVSSVGSGYMLSARLISPTDGALLGAERVTADDDTELIAAIDQLSARLRARIGESLKDVRASPALNRVTTSSLEALRKYTRAAHIDEQEGDPRRAVPLLEEAVALDTTFAMAYRKLGNNLSRSGRDEAGVTAIVRAFELRARATELERYLIEAYYYGWPEYDGARLASAYRSVLALDPENYIALNNLAVYMSHTQQWGEQESLALRAVEMSGVFMAYNGAYRAQLAQGKFTEARATIDRYVEAHPNLATPAQIDLLLAQRKYERAESMIREQVARTDIPVGARGNAMESLGDLMQLRGRMDEAERWFREWMAGEYGSVQDFDAVYHLAALQSERGAPAEAMRLLNSFPANALPAIERPYLELAEFHAAAGRLDRARNLAVQYEERVPAGLRKHSNRRKGWERVSGEIALNEGRFDDAVAAFAMVNELSGLCTTCGLARLAHAWLQSGQPDSALSVYERMVSTPIVSLHDDDVRWLPDSYIRLGELYEVRNDTTNAVRCYHEFVELWKDADPELQPLVEDIRRRMGMLTRER
jgi:tetratricopeptide (TPR) repeat protein